MSLYIDRHPPTAGSSIDQQRNASFGRYGSQRGEVLNRAEIMVGVVRGDEDSFVGDRLRYSCGRQAALAIHRHARGGEPLLLEPGDRLVDRGMFDIGENKVRAAFALGFGYAFDSEVVGLRAGAGEHEIVGRRPDHRGALGSGGVERFAGFEPMPVQGGRIAVDFL